MPAGWGLEASTFSGHSLRSGFLTSAAESGANVSEVSRHRSLDTLRGYVRCVDLFKEHARPSCEAENDHANSHSRAPRSPAAGRLDRAPTRDAPPVRA